jgi:hypothetical protein
VLPTFERSVCRHPESDSLYLFEFLLALFLAKPIIFADMRAVVKDGGAHAFLRLSLAKLSAANCKICVTAYSPNDHFIGQTCQ